MFEPGLLREKVKSLFPWIKAGLIIGLLVFLLRYENEGSTRYEAHGQARLVDGDSLHVKGIEIRLKDIDAPEGRQLCQRRGKDWRCGREATRRLRRFINRRDVSCKGDQYDRYDRLLAYCKVAGREINQWMVQEGWAVSFGGYRREERAARQGKKGIWSSQFERPRVWRANQRR